MSALAHYLEDEGVPTVVISLIRLHTEKIGSPRALWVPFELGRPLGPPNDAAFQTRVLTAALALLESDQGPVILEDFPDEAPNSTPDASWTSPIGLPAVPMGNDPSQARVALLSEIAAVTPWYRLAVERYRRTTVGLSGLDMGAIADRLAASTGGTIAHDPASGLSPIQQLRYAIDDLKAYYLEAASAGTGTPSGRQLADWFWDHTVAAKLIAAVRAQCLASTDNPTRFIGGNLLVPGVQAGKFG